MAAAKALFNYPYDDFKPEHAKWLIDKKKAAEAIITTQKDAVRFPKIDRRDLPIYFMRVEIKILNGADDFQDCVRKICFR